MPDILGLRAPRDIGLTHDTCQALLVQARTDAARLRECIYGAGHSVAPQQARAALRGRMPSIGPLVRKRGLLA